MDKPYALSSSFGTYCFEDHDIIVESILEEFPEIREDMHEIVGGDGSVLRSTYLGPRTITLECRVFRDRWLDFDSVRSELSALLYTRDERELALRSHFGEHYLAHLSGMSEGDREGGVGIGAITLTFTASDPIRFGRVHEVTVPSSHTVEIDVAGTYPASVSLASDVAIKSMSSDVWGVRFDEGHPLHVKLPTGQQSRVSIDCRNTSVSVNGVTGMITLDSHWPELTPGRHVVRMDQGTGDATLTWQERWI
jgi:predicted phage tail component-like protein